MGPSLLQQVLQGVVAAVPEPPDPLTLAEALWLAPLLLEAELQAEAQEPAAPSGRPASGLSAGPAREEARETTAGKAPPPTPKPPPSASTADPQPDEPAASTPAPASAAAPLLPREALPREADVDALRHLLPVWLEDPPLLADSLALLRALAPLQAEPVAGLQVRLDEEATVEAYVRSCGPDGRGGCWQPVLVPIPEPRYELVLLIDTAPTMAIWQRLVLDLQRALASCGVVRQLQLVRLAPDGSVPPRQRLWCQPHPEGRRLFLLLSDCSGDAWWSGAMAERLAAWGPAQTRAVLQVLPSWMWERTALGLGEALVLRNIGTAANVRLLAERQRWLAAAADHRASSTIVPVLRCAPEGLASWSGLLSSRPRQLCAGVQLPTAAVDSDGAEGVEEEPAPASELEQLEAFAALATPRACRLLQLLAAAPVLTLPVIRLVRQALLFDDRTPLATAEVLLGGVVQLQGETASEGEALGAAELWQFTMAPEVRAQLLRQGDAVDAVTVFNAVTRLVEERWNQFMPRGSFRAFLTDPFEPAPPQLAGIEGFASVAAQVLEPLGGDYAALARQLRDGARKRPEEPWPAEEFAFAEWEVETGALLPAGFLSLQPLEVKTAAFKEMELELLAFQTATLASSPRLGWRAFVQRGRQPAITRQEGTCWRFREPLGEPQDPAAGQPLALTMVEIPAGRFQMGSPPEEPNRYSDEGPQHEVTLASFFLSQTPITQAQWRQVAGWKEREGERWGRELKANPSRFQGKEGLLAGESNTDHRPVEKVSWHDAMEFCHRLSQRTGRTYTLPSEAQWEYACRAGTTTPFGFGEWISPELANYDGSVAYADGPKGENREQTTPVGMFPANAWGLQDMHGNVWEWCLDEWHDNYEGAPSDGRAWLDDGEREKSEKTEKRRLLRGGSWRYGPGDCRSAYRFHFLPVNALNLVGFRVVCLPQGPSLNS